MKLKTKIFVTSAALALIGAGIVLAGLLDSGRAEKRSGGCCHSEIRRRTERCDVVGAKLWPLSQHPLARFLQRCAVERSDVAYACPC